MTQAFGDLSITAFQTGTSTSCNLTVSEDEDTWFSFWPKVSSSSRNGARHAYKVGINIDSNFKSPFFREPETSSFNLSCKSRSSLGIRSSKAGLTNTAHALIFFRVFLLSMADAGVVTCSDLWVVEVFYMEVWEWILNELCHVQWMSRDSLSPQSWYQYWNAM